VLGKNKHNRAPDRLILIISHDFEFLSLVADELLFMKKGSIVSHTAFTAADAERIFERLRSDEKERKGS